MSMAFDTYILYNEMYFRFSVYFARAHPDGKLQAYLAANA